MNDTIANLVSSLYEVRQQKLALEKTEKGLLEQIKPLVDPELDRFAETSEKIEMGIDRFVLTRTQGTSRTIQSDLLLERGVAPDIIAFATKTTTYFQYRVKEAK